MRLWTLHPRYLDPQGLVALWREALLARAVLRGETRGYRHHPQLQRFRAHPAPRSAINAYLASIHQEAALRGYSFDRSKFGPVRHQARLVATDGQVDYERRHLLRKLKRRNPGVYQKWRRLARAEPHPLFSIKAGPVEVWERVLK